MEHAGACRAEAHRLPAGIGSTGAGGMRILIVDDDRDHAGSLAEVLECRRNAVELAGTGEEAVARTGAAEFDLVFMDVRLPGIDGVEAFFRMRRLRPTARVMMMTGHAVEHLVARVIEHGALGILHKPFDPSAVLAAIGAATMA
jgi:two-component system, NtrC family, response regulator HydG